MHYLCILDSSHLAAIVQLILLFCHHTTIVSVVGLMLFNAVLAFLPICAKKRSTVEQQIWHYLSTYDFPCVYAASSTESLDHVQLTYLKFTAARASCIKMKKV